MGVGINSVVWFVKPKNKLEYYVMKQYTKDDNDSNEPFGPQYQSEILFYQEVLGVLFGELNEIDYQERLAEYPNLKYIIKLYEHMEINEDAWLIYEYGKRTLADRMYTL